MLKYLAAIAMLSALVIVAGASSARKSVLPQGTAKAAAASTSRENVVSGGVNSEGQKTHVEYTYNFDGKDYPYKPMLDGKPDPNGADILAPTKRFRF